MIDLLIAILLALGVHVDSGSTEEQIKKDNPDAYNKAETIISTGTYTYTDTGVIIVETGGD
ncbi:MAG TPA: hypothetical protein VFW78_06900 [Bacteroidia bacterium]|nr:hypothetical protein [Bacteroidia bacterium]